MLESDHRTFYYHKMTGEDMYSAWNFVHDGDQQMQEVSLQEGV